MKVLVVDDQEAALAGTTFIIEQMEEITQVVGVSTGLEAVELVRKEPFDLVILDLSMPDMDGFQVLSRIRNLGITVPVLVHSYLPGSLFTKNLLSMDVNGFMCKSATLEELYMGVRKILAGGTYMPAPLIEWMAIKSLSQTEGVTREPYDSLNALEQQVFFYISQGLSLEEIASRLNLARTTVSTYRNRLLKKLDLKNDVGIIHYAVKNKIL
jgi:two-component system, NarL family, invasion response regulator UvrY